MSIAPQSPLIETTRLKQHLGISVNVSPAELDDTLAAQGINPKQLLIQEDFKTWFWSRKYSESRNWNWVVIVFQALYQVKTVISPKTPRDWNVNAFYILLSLVMIGLQVASYKVRWKGALVFTTMCTLGLRISFRLLDIE